MLEASYTSKLKGAYTSILEASYASMLKAATTSTTPQSVRHIHTLYTTSVRHTHIPTLRKHSLTLAARAQRAISRDLNSKLSSKYQYLSGFQRVRTNVPGNPEACHALNELYLEIGERDLLLETLQHASSARAPRSVYCSVYC